MTSPDERQEIVPTRLFANLPTVLPSMQNEQAEEWGENERRAHVDEYKDKSTDVSRAFF